ncbi:MAG: hypothetical protein QF473_19955 [Planctomycetota bacterium]|nr:hypothetical protein [Planctomycetota bacterium]MDP6505985.1 hypothetical protein [Planctomycetota bacterium]
MKHNETRRGRELRRKRDAPLGEQLTSFAISALREEETWKLLGEPGLEAGLVDKAEG